LTPIRLLMGQGPGFTLEDFRRPLADPRQPPVKCFDAALGLSWRQRVDAGFQFDVPAIDSGPAQIVQMPAESPAIITGIYEEQADSAGFFGSCDGCYCRYRDRLSSTDSAEGG
jgi:hypothetical protein